MARSRRRRDHETQPIASAAVGSHRYRPIGRAHSDALGDFLDLRTFHPEGRSRPFTAIRPPRSSSNIITSKPIGVRKVSRLTFRFPQNVSVCVRRKTRREVLMALGKGGGRHSPPRLTDRSKISCRRR